MDERHHVIFSPISGSNSEQSLAWQYRMKKKKYQKLFLVGVVVWVMLSFIFFCQTTDLNLVRAFILPNPPMRPIYVPLDDTSTEQLTEKERRRARPNVHPVMQQNLSLDESWADKAVRALWSGWASSNLLSSYLQKAKKDYTSLNLYKVTYTGRYLKKQRDRNRLLCQLKQQGTLRTLTGSEEPFASLGWKKLVPSQPLDLAITNPYRTCAVVSSAGAILNSSLGKEIGEWLGLVCKQGCIDTQSPVDCSYITAIY